MPNPTRYKNIVICCDGTNNQLDADGATNVLRLHRLLDHRGQATYYDPGVGTFALPGLVSPAAKRASQIAGLAFGVGFRQNLEEAYRFLMSHYQVYRDAAGTIVDHDRIFLFGFSRGAYTVRALAGMVHMCGLLQSGADNLVPYVSGLYLGKRWDDARELKWHNDSRFEPRALGQGAPVQVEFLGVWDTVSSLGWIYKRKTLPYTAANPIVRRVRHALAIDEKRAYFRQNRWRPPKDGEILCQDVREVWFTGVHSDVGGGYPRRRSGLAKITLQWMVEQAADSTCGTALRIDDDRYRRLVLGDGIREPGPDPAGRKHESLRAWWWPAELLPMNHTLDRGDFTLPLGRRRWIQRHEWVHASVRQRLEGSDYAPSNLRPRDELRWEEWSGTPPTWSPAAGEDPNADPDDDSTARKVGIGALGALAGYGVLAYVGMLGVLALLAITAGLGLLNAPQSEHGPLVAWMSQALHPLRSVGALVVSLRARPSELLLVLLPLVGFRAGAAFCAAAVGETDDGQWTTFRRATARFEGSPVYSSWRGYTVQRLVDQLYLLHTDGRRALILSLKRDDLAAPLYALSLGAALWLSVRLAPTTLPSWTPWLYLLAFGGPAVGALLPKLARRRGSLSSSAEDRGGLAVGLSVAVAVLCPTALLAVLIAAQPGVPARLSSTPSWMAWLGPVLPWVWLLPLVTLLADLLENAHLRDFTRLYGDAVSTPRGHALGQAAIESQAGELRRASHATILKIWTFLAAATLILTRVVDALRATL